MYGTSSPPAAMTGILFLYRSMRSRSLPGAAWIRTKRYNSEGGAVWAAGDVTIASARANAVMRRIYTVRSRAGGLPPEGGNYRVGLEAETTDRLRGGGD